MKRPFFFLVALCQLMLLFNPVWALNDSASPRPVLAPQRTLQNQQHLPDRQIAQLQGQIKIAPAVNTPETILKRLQSANQIPPEVWPTLQIERSDTLNASTDGKNLMITDTLLAKLRNDDERAFVLSHELAHILLSHISKTQLRRTGLSLLDYFLERKAGPNSLLATASRLGINLVDLKSSRGYEYQADDLGVQLMSKAGYNPQAAIQVFDILEANNPTGGTPGFLLSHPISRSRIEALVKKYKLSLQ
ncbi:M48 family metalloprotease [Vampirovibrio chlorellavorus]|uniref:M48 family metalloprotease n=1 Tax=Vampirovibrio chlorellavorus TaxID=758823 RepID=UPI0026ED13A0|nr:M48 family metalloprotease [Vampirovibrio chlorellavorus]